jgi:hypothetical protein
MEKKVTVNVVYNEKEEVFQNLTEGDLDSLLTRTCSHFNIIKKNTKIWTEDGTKVHGQYSELVCM